jgi:surface antigen
MNRYLFACVPLLLLSAQAPVFAKERGVDSAGQKCQPKKKKRGGMFGAIAGGIAGSALGHAGLPGTLIGIGLPVGSLLTDAILKKLDCKEQVQAATATDNAVRGGVGTTSTWESETRPGVKGSSTVVAQAPRAGGGSCMEVNDVVIVNGEETTVSKRMCRAPGASGYTLAA